MTPETKKKIEDAIAAAPIVIFMKGTPDFPQCGFSAATVDCFQRLGAKFTTVDVLADGDVRQGVKEFSSWPTIPQVYLNGEFLGGCDITRELFASGELEKTVNSA